MSCSMKDTDWATGHQYACTDTIKCAQVVPVFVHFFKNSVTGSHSECHTFEQFKPNSASKVTRSRRSSAWPIPFYGHFLTSPSGIGADAHEESAPRGTEEGCLCSGCVGRSHTVHVG